jgi:hypothetical protein
MTNTLRRAATLYVLLAAFGLVAVAPAFSQAPTQAQRAAIKSKCRSDYIAHCSSIPPGGEASLQCLQKNMSSLAPGCQTAVRAVEAPAEPKAEAKPEAKPDSAPAATTTAKPVEPAATAPNTATSKSTAPNSAAPKAAAANPGAAPAAPALVLRPMRPREELLVLRSACGGDVRSLCGGLAPGGGRIVRCLATQAASLSPACKDVLGQFAAR